MWRSLASVLVLSCAAACGDPEIVVPDVLSVTFLPPQGSIGISTDMEALVYFSHAIQTPTAVQGALSMVCLGSPPCAAENGQGCSADPTVATTITFELNQVAHVKPNQLLTANTCYSIRAAAGVEANDKNVGPLPVDFHSAFQTAP